MDYIHRPTSDLYYCFSFSTSGIKALIVSLMNFPVTDRVLAEVILKRMV